MFGFVCTYPICIIIEYEYEYVYIYIFFSMVMYIYIYVICTDIHVTVTYIHIWLSLKLQTLALIHLDRPLGLCSIVNVRGWLLSISPLASNSSWIGRYWYPYIYIFTHTYIYIYIYYIHILQHEYHSGIHFKHLLFWFCKRTCLEWWKTVQETAWIFSIFEVLCLSKHRHMTGSQCLDASKFVPLQNLCPNIG